MLSLSIAQHIPPLLSRLIFEVFFFAIGYFESKVKHYLSGTNVFFETILNNLIVVSSLEQNAYDIMTFSLWSYIM